MPAATVAQSSKPTIRPRVDRFAFAVANGATYSAAYRMMTGNTNRGTCEVGGHQLANRPDVAERIRYHQEAIAKRWHMQAAKRRSLLGQIAEAGAAKAKRLAKPSDAIAAIREDAILAGERVERAQMSAQVDVRAALCALVGSAPPEARTATATGPAGSVAPVEGGGEGGVAPAAPAAVQAATLPALPAWLPAVSVLAPAAPAAETFEDE